MRPSWWYHHIYACSRPRLALSCCIKGKPLPPQNLAIILAVLLLSTNPQTQMAEPVLRDDNFKVKSTDHVTKMVSEYSLPVNGGHGRCSYSKNSYYQVCSNPTCVSDRGEEYISIYIYIYIYLGVCVCVCVFLKKSDVIHMNLLHPE